MAKNTWAQPPPAVPQSKALLGLLPEKIFELRSTGQPRTAVCTWTEAGSDFHGEGLADAPDLVALGGA